MIIIDENKVFSGYADVELDKHWYDSVNKRYFQKENLGFSVTNVSLPNETWAIPRQAKLVNGVWVQNPDYVAPEE